MRREIAYLIFFTFLLSFLTVKDALAVTTSVSNIPQTISSEPFTVNVTVSGASAGTNYLRVDLYKPSATNYFGETYNGSNWYGGSDETQYLPITIETGSDWVGQIQARVGNPSSGEYSGAGQYKLRIRRYRPKTYDNDEANKSAVDINIDLSSSTPTQALSPTNTQQPTESVAPLITPAPTSNIYISEVMIDPETGSKEWIEIYNGNGYETTLSDWYIDDVENGGSAPKKFSLTIQANSYVVSELSTSVFNNDGDKVRLLDPNQKELDSLEYQSSKKGKSLGRTSFKSDIFCLQESSKGKANNPCLNPTSTGSSQSSSSSTKTPTYTPKSSFFPTTKISTQKLTVKPTKNYFVSRNDPDFTDNMTKTAEDNVLGITTKEKGLGDSSTRALLSSLTFTSFTYSVLAVISIFYKIKMKMSHDTKTHLHPGLT